MPKAKYHMQTVTELTAFRLDGGDPDTMWVLLHAPVTERKELTIVLGVRQTPRRIRVKAGDQAILFERLADDVVFWAQGPIHDVVTDSVQKTIDDEQVAFTRFSATVHEFTPFTHHRSLAELRYSLERVRNFVKPERHFLLDYGLISPRDARVITEELIHWSRTAVGMMAEVITSQDQLEIARRWQELPLKLATSYDSLAKLVLDFIESRYSSFSSLLAATCAMTDEMREWGDLVVVTQDSESNDSKMNLSNFHQDAADFNEGWTSADNPFRRMIKLAEDPIFTKTKVDANEVQKLLLFR